MVWGFTLVVAACAGSHGAQSTASNTTTATHSRSADPAPLFSPDARADLEGVRALTALGDSVPYGSACKCTPYPQLVAKGISQLTGHTVTTYNDAVPGDTTAGVLQALDDNGAARRDVEASDMVLIEVGANDVARTQHCQSEVACYQPQIPAPTSLLNEVVRKVHDLAPAHVRVVMLDYWNVWLGGQYALAQGADYTDTADALTTQVNQAIRATANASSSTYVDLRTAFRGPDHDEDETSFLAPDGDHPNAEGHELIAEAIAASLAG